MPPSGKLKPPVIHGTSMKIAEKDSDTKRDELKSVVFLHQLTSIHRPVKGLLCLQEVSIEAPAITQDHCPLLLVRL